jgi:hypothetical protein
MQLMLELFHQLLDGSTRVRVGAGPYAIPHIANQFGKSSEITDRALFAINTNVAADDVIVYVTTHNASSPGRLLT